MSDPRSDEQDETGTDETGTDETGTDGTGTDEQLSDGSGPAGHDTQADGDDDQFQG